MSKDQIVKKFVNSMIKNLVAHKDIGSFVANCQTPNHGLANSSELDSMNDRYNRKNKKNNSKNSREL